MAALLVTVPALGADASGSSQRLVGNQPTVGAPFSAFVDSEDGNFTPRPAGAGSSISPAAPLATAATTVGSNVDVIAGHDVTMATTINGKTVSTCNPGKPTAQNETTIAVNPANASNLVGGTNDYRLYEPTENRYDGSGGFYTSTTGGSSWTVGFLPGLVKGNSAAPGPYETAGDPSVAAGPSNTFWYANLVFNRSDNASGVAVSRSTNSGTSWTTHFVYQTSAAAGATLMNDKEWVAASPTNSSVAYVAWTQFVTNSNGSQSSFIVISKTTNGGSSWSAPVKVSSYPATQDATVLVGSDGFVYVTFEAFGFHGKDVVAWTKSQTAGSVTFLLNGALSIATIRDIASPLPRHQFRDNSFPSFAMDGTHQYIAWSNWNGKDADIVYMTSSNSGSTWTAPVTLAGGAGNQFFPALSARAGKVAVTWFDDAPFTTDRYRIRATVSTNSGSTWNTAATLSSASSDVPGGNNFGFPNCAPDFIGDYNAVAIGSNGVAHALWTDIRDRSTALATNQDPYTATVS